MTTDDNKRVTICYHCENSFKPRPNQIIVNSDENDLLSYGICPKCRVKIELDILEDIFPEGLNNN